MPDSRGIPYRYKAKRLVCLAIEMGCLWLYQKTVFPFIKDGWKGLYLINARLETIENELDYLFPPREN
jgi:hypothetical protein